MAILDDPNKKDPAADPAYQAGASARKFVSGGTAWDSMGKGYIAQGEATASAAKPVRNFAAGLVGAAPPQNTPAVTRPLIKFAGTDAAPETMFKRPASTAPAPRTAAQLDAASAAEVAARNKASPASSSPGVGAPAGTGGGSASGYLIGSNGVRRNINGDGTIAGADPKSVSVNRQAFGGTPTPSTASPAYQRTLSTRSPVASTYGMSVNDPRMNDQSARPVLPNAVPAGTAFRDAGQMAEHYNAREDREARQKLASDLDSQRFRLEMIAGNPGRRGRAAIDALGQNAQQRAALTAGGERLSADAVQSRAQRANVLANTGLEQAGADRRAEMADATTREGQQLGYRADMARTGADLVRPQLLQDADGNYVSVSAGRGQPVTRPDGQPVRGLVSGARNYQQEADDKLFSDLIANQVDVNGQPLPNAIETAQQQFAAIRRGAGAAGQPQNVAFDAAGKRYTRNTQGVFVDDQGNPFKAK
ncbi:MAG TPA: hypothetical protein VGE09_03465 [Pseudoxanthomonas sp.]